MRLLRRLSGVVVALGAIVVVSPGLSRAVPIDGVEDADAHPPLASAGVVAVEQLGACSSFTNFDELAQPTGFLSTIALRDEYLGLGVRFSHTNIFDGGAIIDEDGNFGVSGHSSPNFLAFNCGASLQDGGTPQGPEILTFTNLVGSVSMLVGSAGGAGTELTMEAYDSNDRLVGRSSVVLAAAMQQISVCSARIKRVIVGVARPCVWVLDNLCFVEADINLVTTVAVAGQEVGVTAGVTGFTPASGTLSFRLGGSTAFESADMTVNGQTLSGQIPAGRVTARGVEFFVEIQGFICVLRVPGSAPGNPAFLPVTFANERLSPVPARETYILTGLPFLPNNGEEGSVLVDDLGDYNIRRWRLGHFNPADSTYAEFPATPSFAPGVGFWLIMRNPVAVGAAGVSINAQQNFSIPVEPGWNQIAHPFFFPVDIAQVTFGANVDNRIVGFVNGGYVDQTVLRPWSGYWVFNAGAVASDITVQPIESAGLRLPVGLAGKADVDGGFAIEVALRHGDVNDRRNLAGTAGGAREGLDPLDRREPPAPPGFGSVYFTREDGGRTHALTADFQPLSGEGTTWTLAVDAPASATGTPATLTFSGIETVPPKFEVVLLRGEDGTDVDLRAAREIVLPQASTARYQLAAGTSAYMTKIRGSEQVFAGEFALEAASPMPARDQVAVGFTLPEPADVRFRIYDVDGRLVRMLLRERMEAGRHAITWTGLDDAGHAVPSGIFFGRLEAGKRQATAKLLLLR